MKRLALIFALMAIPATLFAGGITVQFGGGGYCAPSPCYSYPVFFPPYSYYGYAPYPYYYASPVPGYSYSSGSSFGMGRTIKLGEDHDSFWDKHGGFEPAAYSTVATEPLIEVAGIDRKSPLQPGDLESRIRDLDLDVSSINASGEDTVYFLSDGRKVTAQQGVILDIAQ